MDFISSTASAIGLIQPLFKAYAQTLNLLFHLAKVQEVHISS